LWESTGLNRYSHQEIQRKLDGFIREKEREREREERERDSILINLPNIFDKFLVKILFLLIIISLEKVIEEDINNKLNNY